MEDCLVIASQAIITGCFSLLSQAGSLDFCPPFHVKHTSEKMFGQIYVPVRFSPTKSFLILISSDYQLDLNVFNDPNDSLFSKFFSFNQCLWFNSL